MEAKKKTTKTGELWQRLFKSPDVRQYIDANEASLRLPAFNDYLMALCKKQGELPEQIIRRSGIERSFGHHIFRGSRKPSRDTVLQLAFGFRLKVDEAQELLKAARLSPLYPKVKRDAVIAHCLYKGFDIISTQQLLHELELPVIGWAVNGK